MWALDCCFEHADQIRLCLISSYLACATLSDLVAAVVDDPDDYDITGLTDAFRAALNAKLAGTGISLSGDEVSSTDPAHEDSDEVDALIGAAFEAADLDALLPHYRKDHHVPVTEVGEPVPPESDVSAEVAGRTRRRARSALVDLDTVREERGTDPVRPGWRVLAGPGDDPVMIGFLERLLTATGGRGGRWQARTAHNTVVPGGPWRTRRDAKMCLVEAYQRAASARR